MTILILAEHDNQNLDASLRHVLTAAKKIGGDIHVLVAGQSCAAVASQAATLAGVAKVLLADSAEYKDGLAENTAPLIVSLADAYSHILASASSFGKDVLPRAAAQLDIAQISDIVAVETADTFVRPIYAGNALATVQSSDAKKIITVRKVAFDITHGDQAAAPIENIPAKGGSPLASFAGLEATKSERPELTSARVVVSGGRGLASRENFAVIETLADAFGGAVGASRAAVDAGYAPNDWQVGQTGKVVAPEIYVAVGISGAIQHLAGMKDSKVIVAINKDENAPIFEVADYGLVADLFQAVPELTAAVKK